MPEPRSRTPFKVSKSPFTASRIPFGGSRPQVAISSVAPLGDVTRKASPERWDVPFGDQMTDQDVEGILKYPLFAATRADRFPPSIPLRGILRNDTRIKRYQHGELVVRQGDYGHSAFVILSGSVRVMLQEPPAAALGRREGQRPSVLGSIGRWFRRSRFPEQAATKGAKPPGLRAGSKGEARIFLQDVPGVLDPDRTVKLSAGELFGEIAALGRTARTATVLADGDAELLEIRWQGLREIRRFSPEWKEEIDRRYRQRSLLTQLGETDFLKNLPKEALQKIADAARFETFGEFDWHGTYNRARDADDRERMEQEPIIAREGDYANGLLLVRSGFARVSAHYNHGERTVSYLGKGEGFGLEEIATAWRSGVNVPLRHSLRALGYVDLLFIPTAVIEEHVLPALTPEQITELTLDLEPAADAPAAELTERGGDNFFEFIVAQRFINGRAAMLIDLDRCTRCDDCVRACAATHDNNARFIRQGPEASGVMVASACMHCADPVCMIGCPTGAISRDAAAGQVVINPDTCIGCGTCAQSCPYGNIQMVALVDEGGYPIVDQEKGTAIKRATKCDLCIDQPGGPACVRACPHDALWRADMRDIDAVTAWLHR
jgi:Fe-S-cluster-containing dehydrogenase component/CRP-like cAMP-binding protein